MCGCDWNKKDGSLHNCELEHGEINECGGDEREIDDCVGSK
jgi:hypothetical protein